MAQLVRPLRHWPRFHHHPHHNLSSFLFSPSPSLSETASLRHLFGRVVSVPAAHRTVHHHSRGLRFPNSPPRPPPFDLRHGGGDFSDSDADSWKSRNQKKRDARGAVRWGMELASFPNSQIKRILRVASLEQEVFDALMLVKKLGPDVREGKRRQFNYIGKLLREVEPELMDALIQATKDGDQSRLQELSVSEAWTGGGEEDDDDDDEDFEAENEDDEEECVEHVSIASRWFNGLISKDVEITNEVYSIHTVDFDRQELRKLVRSVQAIQEQPATTEENETPASVAVIGAQKSLTHFLCNLAKQLPSGSM